VKEYTNNLVNCSFKPRREQFSCFITLLKSAGISYANHNYAMLSMAF